MSDTNNTQPEKAKEYHLTMKFNGMVFACETDDLEEAMRSFKPAQIKTKMVVLVKRADGKGVEKLILLQKAKLMFRNKLALKMFVNKLIFT